MKNWICTACLLIGILFPAVIFAESGAGEVYTPQSWTESYVELNRTGMLTLGSWALLNFAVSAPGWFTTAKDSTWHYVHEMNVMWNLVNIALAGFGYHGLGEDLENPPASAIGALELSNDMQEIWLFNAGLDVAYMTAGTLMLWLGNSDQKRLRGYGASVLVQGAFLFVLDLTFYFLNSSQVEPLIALGTDGSRWLASMSFPF